MAKQLFKTNANLLRKALFALQHSQKMNGTQVILSPLNQEKKKEAEAKISEAITLLESIQSITGLRS